MKPSDVFNTVMALMLRSPLHFLLGESFMLLRFSGRKTGKSYTIPVNCFFEGNWLTVFTLYERRWWRNLAGGAPVAVRLRGRERKGFAGAFPRDARVFGSALRSYLEKCPSRAKYFGLTPRADGTLDELDEREMEKAASERVVVRIELSPANEQR